MVLAIALRELPRLAPSDSAAYAGATLDRVIRGGAISETGRSSSGAVSDGTNLNPRRRQGRQVTHQQQAKNSGKTLKEKRSEKKVKEASKRPLR